MTIGNYHGDEVEFVPPGTITIWTQNTSEIPAGWALCDGGNGTPNLLGRFVKGTSGSNPGDVGGTASYTISSSQMRSHSHGGSTNSTGSHNHSIGKHTYTSGSGGYLGGTNHGSSEMEATRSCASAGSHSHTINSVESVGSGNSVDNIPAYMEVCYIMKL